MSDAPYLSGIAEGPETGRALWVTASDGVRLRVGLWPGGTRGTVVIFPGRTEFIEKWGRLAGDLAAQGFSAAAIDWRGQGMADRVAADPNLGHVGAFSDYQLDVAAYLGALRAAAMPEPYLLLGHSMGGEIGLRAVLSGLPVVAAGFSAPLWGLTVEPHLRPFSRVLPKVMSALGMGLGYSPGTTRPSYLLTSGFEDNNLTSDPAEYARLQRQAGSHPGFALGGPSFHWVDECLTETRALARAAPLEMPVLTVVGSDEAVTDPAAMHAMMARWPQGAIAVIEGARHEIFMEAAALRQQANDRFLTFFAAHAPG